MVKEVEELSPELQAHALAEGQNKVLDRGEVRVYEVRTGDRRAGAGSKFARRCYFEGTRIKPRGQSVYLGGRRASRICRHWAPLVWVAHLVGAIKAGTTV